MATTAIDTRLTDHQKAKRRKYLKAVDVLLDFAAPEIPPLGQMTAEGQVDQAGFINEMRKDIEKVEKIQKERLKALLGQKKEVRGEAYQVKVTTQERYALNQGLAKDSLKLLGRLDIVKFAEWLEENPGILPADVFLPAEYTLNCLESHMSTTDVDTMRFSDL